MIKSVTTRIATGNPTIPTLNAALLTHDTDPLSRKNQKYIQSIHPSVGMEKIEYKNGLISSLPVESHTRSINAVTKINQEISAPVT